jgi:hypothetical protein
VRGAQRERRGKQRREGRGENRGESRGIAKERVESEIIGVCH